MISNFKLTRLSGAGNTFFLLDGFENSISDSEAKALAVQVCRRTPGKETDGLFVIQPDQEVDFKWLFFNDDGSRPKMCGNAARCAALYFGKKNGFRKMKSRFRTDVGIVAGQILSATPDELGNYQVTVDLPELKDLGHEIKIGEEKIFSINTGVPHLVIEEARNANRGKVLRSSVELGPEGTNVTFLQGINAVSFERGVENFTEACGTGAIAAAAYLRGKTQMTKFDIEMPGGKLQVEWLTPTSPRLTGPTKIDFEMTVERIIL